MKLQLSKIYNIGLDEFVGGAYNCVLTNTYYQLSTNLKLSKSYTRR